MQPSDIDRVKEEIAPLLGAQSVEIVELSVRRSGKTPLLRVLVDRPGGITLGEVSGLNREISARLDELNFLPEPYLLEVSSPGLDRLLKQEEDFRRVRGKTVRIVTRQPLQGENTYTGCIINVANGAVTVDSKERGRVTLSLEEIAKAKQVIQI